MITINTSATTFLAMGVLIQNLDTLRFRARKDFASRFEDFKQEENQTAFRQLFSPSKFRTHHH
jgi:hypothetical protein